MVFDQKRPRIAKNVQNSEKSLGKKPLSSESPILVFWDRKKVIFGRKRTFFDQKSINKTLRNLSSGSGGPICSFFFFFFC